MTYDYLYIIVDYYAKAMKIGRSQNPKERLAQLQHANPRKLTLYHVFPLLGNSEPGLHIYLQKKFPALHIQGEWYEFTETLIDEVFDFMYYQLCDTFYGEYEYLDMELPDTAFDAMKALWDGLYSCSQLKSVSDKKNTEIYLALPGGPIN